MRIKCVYNPIWAAASFNMNLCKSKFNCHRIGISQLTKINKVVQIFNNIIPTITDTASHCHSKCMHINGYITRYTKMVSRLVAQTKQQELALSWYCDNVGTFAFIRVWWKCDARIFHSTKWNVGIYRCNNVIYGRT